MAIHAMIDLETLDTGVDSVILTCGAIKFDPLGDVDPYAEMYHRIDVDEQTAIGRTVDEGTIEWWGTQPEEIWQEALGDEDRVSVDEFIRDLQRWVVGVDVIWAQGYGFDMTILETLLKSKGHNKPWNFWNLRDSRTLFQLMPKDPRKAMNFAAHNALEDCRAQAKCVQYCYRELGIVKA